MEKKTPLLAHAGILLLGSSWQIEKDPWSEVKFKFVVMEFSSCSIVCKY